MAKWKDNLLNNEFQCFAKPTAHLWTLIPSCFQVYIVELGDREHTGAYSALKYICISYDFSVIEQHSENKLYVVY